MTHLRPLPRPTTVPRLRITPALALLATCAALAGSACSDPVDTPLPTLRSPTSLAPVTWCPVTNADGTRYAPASDCLRGEGADPSRIVARVAVANRGNRFVHILDMNARRPGFVNLDRSVPGLTGVPAPDGPALLALTPMPGLVLVSSEDDPTLSIVDIPNGRLLDTDLPRPDEPLAALQPIPGSGRYAMLLGAERALVIADLDLRCDGDGDGDGDTDNTDPPLYHDACTLEASLDEVARFTLDGRPTALAVDRRGFAYVTLEDHPEVRRFAIGRQALARCGGDTPCPLAPLVADLPGGCLTDTTSHHDPSASDPDLGTHASVPPSDEPAATDASTDADGSPDPTDDPDPTDNP
ncbi:MAG: hypothetical protein EA398_13835, partial [Deltaproteobacteria bacterium]